MSSLASPKPKNAKHLSGTSNWYTPIWLVEKARAVLGGIGFDPASDVFGNSRIKAGQYFSDGALEKPWPKCRTVFLNPPGGKIGNESRAAHFWARLYKEWEAGTFQSAIFVGFTIEIMQTSQTLGVPPPQAFPFCVPSNRTSFDNGKGVPGTNPTHCPVIFYLPYFEDSRTGVFEANFTDVGYVRT